SFASSDPQSAMRGADRLTSLIIDGSLRDREILLAGTVEFLKTQIDDMKQQIVAFEKVLDQIRATSGGRRLSQADVLQYEALQETLKALLLKSQDAKFAESLESRQIGEQWRVVDQPRLPDRPSGPNRTLVDGVGGLTG